MKKPSLMANSQSDWIGNLTTEQNGDGRIGDRLIATKKDATRIAPLGFKSSRQEKVLLASRRQFRTASETLAARQTEPLPIIF
ncbi:MAG: hypothetical protein ABIR24_04880 [Verrucomicrobiota bacterium]